MYPERILSFPEYDFFVYVYIYLWPTWTNGQFIYHWYISSGTKASSKLRFFSNFLTISETVSVINKKVISKYSTFERTYSK